MVGRAECSIGPSCRSVMCRKGLSTRTVPLSVRCGLVPSARGVRCCLV